jgi:hypothetical protein
MKPGLPHFAKHLILMGFFEHEASGADGSSTCAPRSPGSIVCWRIRLSGPDAVGVA